MIIEEKNNIDHLNVSPYNKILFGRLMSIFYKSIFTIPFFGDFNSPANFILWLFNKNDFYRFNDININYFNAKYGPIMYGKIRIDYINSILYAKYFQFICKKNFINENITKEEIEYYLNILWTSYIKENNPNDINEKELLPEFLLLDYIKQIFSNIYFEKINIENKYFNGPFGKIKLSKAKEYINYLV